VKLFLTGNPSGLYVSENECRRHDSKMEPLGMKRFSVSHAEAKHNITSQEDHSRIETARSIIRLNAEKIFRHRAEGEIFLLTFLFIGLFRDTRWMVRRSEGWMRNLCGSSGNCQATINFNQPQSVYSARGPILIFGSPLLAVCAKTGVAILVPGRCAFCPTRG